MCTSAFAHSDSAIGGQGRGGRQVAAGRTHGQGRGWSGALPSLCTVIRHTSGQGRGRRQADAGRAHGQGRGLPCALPPLRTVIRHTSGMVRHCARGRPPLPSPSPTLRTAARDTGSQRRGLFSGATRTLPGSSRRANDILYIRVRRREGENVLHRAASNNVDNFSVDNPLWITAAAKCRLLCGGCRLLCGGSVNADGGSVNAGAEVQTQTGRVRKPSRAMGTRRRRLSAPWLQFHGVDRADVYIIIRVRACCSGECALNSPTSPPIPRRRPPLAPTQRRRPPRALPLPPRTLPLPRPATMHSSPPSQPIPRRSPSLAPAQRHALPEHFRSPTQPRRTPTQPRRTPLGCAMHSPQPSQPIPRRRPPLAPAAPTHARRLRDARPPTSPPIPRRRPPLAPAQRHALAEHFRPHAAPTHAHAVPNRARRLREAFPAATRCLSFRSASGTKKTAPHSACAMPNVSVDRRCGRSFGLVSRALFAAVAGRWRVGVGLRPQPWALRSRRCGRVLRA